MIPFITELIYTYRQIEKVNKKDSLYSHINAADRHTTQCAFTTIPLPARNFIMTGNN